MDRSSAPLAHAALIADRLSAGYGDAAVIKDLSLTIPRGAFSVLVGANGSGKSTLLRALARLLPAQAGIVRLEGQPLSSFRPKELARRLSILSQGPIAPEGLTVEDLVRQGRYPHRSLYSRWASSDETACQDALRLTSLTELKDRRIETLSGGQRQRAWIAMTLAQQTDILLLDEPTTYLDMAYQVEVLELLEGLVKQQGKTVVAVLHDINQASRHADRISFLKDGRLIAEGAPDQIMTAFNIEQTFSVNVGIVADPFTGKPICVPVPRSNR